MNAKHISDAIELLDDDLIDEANALRGGKKKTAPSWGKWLAAAACLAGENTVGDSLYFLAPQLTDNHWTMENRTFVTTIGTHWFYE